MKMVHVVIASGLWFAALSQGNSFISYLRPSELWVGPDIGLSQTHVRTSQEVTALLMPTPGASSNSFQPIFGGSVQGKWTRHLSLTLALRKERLSIRTPEAIVAFPGNPFPHTLSSQTRLSYNVWPLLLGLHLGSAKRSLVLQAGVYTAFLDERSHQWTVDGEPYAKTPDAQFRSQESGLAFATEFSSQWGRGQWKLGLVSRRTDESLTETWRGRLDLESAQILLGYRWNLFGK